MTLAKGSSFLKISDLDPADILRLTEMAARLKKDKKGAVEKKMLNGRNIALLFEKDSTRTRCAFEVAAHDQGAAVTYIASSGSQMGKKESPRDTARVLGRMYDAIEYRGYTQQTVEVLAEYAGVPVWNGLTNEAHPTQIIADLLTMSEHSDKELSEISVCFLGDARNNVANSLMVGCAMMGMDYRAVSPAEYAPDEKLVEYCNALAARTAKGRVTVMSDVEQGVKGCDFVYTDVWVSMGEDDSLWDKRIKDLLPYQVNAALMEMTGNAEAKFMHCLPAFHDTQTEVGMKIYEKYGLSGLEVTDEVFESTRSVVFDQAENRLHTIKAIMVTTLHGEY